MALDPNIILRGMAQPQQQASPLELASQAMTLRRLAMQNKAAERDEAESEQLKKAFAKNVVANPDGSQSLDRRATLSELYKINPLKATEVERSFQVADAQEQEQRMKKLTQQTSAAKQLAWSITDESSYLAARQRGIELGLPKADSLPPQFPGMGYIQKMQMATLNAEEQLAQMNKDRDFGLREREITAKNRETSQKLATEKKPTAEQMKAAGFAHRVTSAEKIMDDLASQGFDGNDRRSWAQKHLFNEAKPVNLQKQEQAQRNFINAVLRRESGAAISPDEFENSRMQYFPQAGDSPEVLEQKRQNRLDVLATLKAEAGQGFDQVSRQREMIASQMQPPKAQAKPAGSSGSWGIDKAQAAAPRITESDLLNRSDKEIEALWKSMQGGR